MTDLLGKSFGRYHILEQLGEGGMAIVYKAFDTRLERDVALKIIRKGAFPADHVEHILKRFEREAKSLARLSHPHIVKVHDYGEHDGYPYLVMEYLPSGTLKQKMGKPIPWQEALQLLIPIVEALDYAHSQNMIHRDVKPSNILLTQGGQPMLTDFGIAKVLDLEETLDLTGTSAAVGTPEYMAPEQATSRTVDHRVDIYALGIVLYEMVTGRKPFIADTPMAVLIKHATEALPRPKQYVPSLPDSMEKILLKTLAKQPENRYQDMGELLSAFKGVLNDKALYKKLGREDSGNVLPTTGIEQFEVQKIKRPRKINIGTFIVLIGLAGISLGLLGTLLIGNLPSLTPTPTLTLTLTPSRVPTTTPTLIETPSPTSSEESSYIIQEGDSLASIAQKFNLGKDGELLIYYANQAVMDENQGLIFVGQTIILPPPGSVLPTSMPNPASLPSGTILEYQVMPGDTLAGIAFKFNSLTDEIIVINNINDVNALYVGQKLQIPVNLVAPIATLPPTSTPVIPTLVGLGSRPITYTLQPGEFLHCIARRFNVDPEELFAINGLSNNSAIYSGMVVKIPQTGIPFPGNRALRNHPGTYTVNSTNETVYGIACNYGDVDPAAIANANGISVSANLATGQNLTIP